MKVIFTWNHDQIHQLIILENEKSRENAHAWILMLHVK